MVAWAPLGLLHGVADGHNDVLLILPMLLWLLWLLWLERGKLFASALALAVSISIKYLLCLSRFLLFGPNLRYHQPTQLAHPAASDLYFPPVAMILLSRR